MNARMRAVLTGWGLLLAFSFGFLSPFSAVAEPILFSASGQFDLASGPSILQA